MKEYKLAVDVGNTDIVIGIFKEKELIKKARAPLKLIESKLESWLMEELVGLRIKEIGLSCVVPRIHQLIFDTCLKICSEVVEISPSLTKNLVINATNRNELGADLLADAYGALANYDVPTLIFDLGSATKAIYLNGKGELEGVTIKPGLAQSLNSMLQNIPHLPPVELKAPGVLLGHDTITAIQAGIFNSEACAIDGFSKLVAEHYKEKAIVVLTGGFSNLIYQYLPDCVFEPDLVLIGINEILDRY